MKAPVTSSSWKVVVAVNTLISAKALLAFWAEPVTARKVASKSSNFLMVDTIFPKTAVPPIARRTFLIVFKELFAFLVAFSVLPRLLSIRARLASRPLVLADISNNNLSTVAILVWI